LISSIQPYISCGEARVQSAKKDILTSNPGKMHKN
jgi:hypothetical protein